MRKGLAVSLFLMADLVGVAAAQDRTRDAADLRALITATETLANQRDFASFAAMFTPDGDVIAFADAQTIGPAAIRKAFEDGWKAQPATCRIALKVDSIRYLGADVAMIEDSATFVGCKDSPPDRATFVLIRKGGKWQIAAMRIIQAATKK